MALAAIVAYQNTSVMHLKFLFWSISMSTCLMLPIVLFSGIVIGLLFSLLNLRRAPGKVKDKVRPYKIIPVYHS